MTSVALVVPRPGAPSGGHAYNEAVLLNWPGRPPRRVELDGPWPAGDAASIEALRSTLHDHATTLVDGLVGAAHPEVVAEAVAAGHHVVLLVHLPLADEGGLSSADRVRLEGLERAGVHAASRVVTTSRWAAVDLAVGSDASPEELADKSQPNRHQTHELVFACGYSSASLRERLYVSESADRNMSGALIYTAAGDSEGTMGGLVRMARPDNLRQVVASALADARWCSTDPVCMDAGEKGQGPDSCNLAACHACGLLPETSCEEFNRFLDRGLVVGTLENPSLGYFSH